MSQVFYHKFIAVYLVLKYTFFKKGVSLRKLPNYSGVPNKRTGPIKRTD